LAFDGSASRVGAGFKKMPDFGIFPNTVRIENALQMALIHRLDFPCDFNPHSSKFEAGEAQAGRTTRTADFFQPCPGALAIPVRGLLGPGSPAHRTRRI
jgi:hypothetical protein